MPVYLALLRGINVGGNNLVPMADLRAHLEECGFEGVQTLLQSGNVVLTGSESSAFDLEHKLESEMEKRFGLKLSLFVRTQAEWDSVITGNPYVNEATKDPSHLLVIFIKSPPSAEAIIAAQEAMNGPEYFQSSGRELYVVYPAGIGPSKLNALPAWKRLAGHGTGRNWNTVLKLAALANG